MLTSYSKFLQGGDPLPHKVYPMTKLIKKISVRFLKTEIICQGVNIEMLENEGNYLLLEKFPSGYYQKRNFEQKTK